jgi:hypothetical protein
VTVPVPMVVMVVRHALEGNRAGRMPTVSGSDLKVAWRG